MIDEHVQVRRLLLAVARDLDGARQKLLIDVGLSVDGWYMIAVLTAQEMVWQLDAEYLRTMMFAGREQVLNDPGLRARAREHTIRHIERMLAEALDA